MEMRHPARRGEQFVEAGWCLALTKGAYASNLQGFKAQATRFPGTAAKTTPALA